MPVSIIAMTIPRPSLSGYLEMKVRAETEHTSTICAMPNTGGMGFQQHLLFRHQAHVLHSEGSSILPFGLGLTIL